MSQIVAILLVAMTIAAHLVAVAAGIDSPPQTPVPVETFYEVECWEDEVVVQVVHDPYGLAATDLACVPGDNIPWDPDGFRPDR